MTFTSIYYSPIEKLRQFAYAKDMKVADEVMDVGFDGNLYKIWIMSPTPEERQELARLAVDLKYVEITEE